MVYWRELEVLSTGTLTRGAVPDELEVLQYGAAGVDVTVINAVQVSFNQQQKTWKLTWLHRQCTTYTLTALVRLTERLRHYTAHTRTTNQWQKTWKLTWLIKTTHHTIYRHICSSTSSSITASFFTPISKPNFFTNPSQHRLSLFLRTGSTDSRQ